MRASLFVPALFAMTFAGGLAFAEPPHRERPVREPVALERVHAHGDIVDKFSGAHARALDRVEDRSLRVGTPREKKQFEARANCSDIGECNRSARVLAPRPGSAEGPTSAKAASRTMDRFSHASDKRNCSDVGGECDSTRNQVKRDKTYDPTKKDLTGAAKTKNDVQQKNKDDKASHAKASPADQSPSDRAQAKKVIGYIMARMCQRNANLCDGFGGGESR